MTIERIQQILSHYDFSLYGYYEKGVLCGYEMETWTDGGVNMIHFIDCRDSGVIVEAILSELNEIVDDFDTDGEVLKHMASEDYRRHFTLQSGLDDFTEYKRRLKSAVFAVNHEGRHRKELD